MPDLFQSLDTPIFPWVWGGSIVALLVMAFIQVYYGRRLRTTAAPRGIVALELAGTEERTRAILDSWHHVPGARADATRGLYWDLDFLLVYATVLSHLCAWAGRTADAAWNWPGAAGAGVLLAWLSWLAAACDAGENACLLRQLKAGPGAALAAAARTFAVSKFVLIGIGLAFVAGGIVAFFPYLGEHVHFAAAHPVLGLVLLLLYGFIYGLIGTGNGIPSLFWHDRFRVRIAASCGATLLLLEIGLIVYYQERDTARSLVATVAGQPPWGGDAATPRQNVEYLKTFLILGGIPLLLLLAAPAILPRLFPWVPRTPMKQGGLGFEASERLKKTMRRLETAASDRMERAISAPAGKWRWFLPHVWGSLTWLFGIVLGILVAWLALSLALWSYAKPDLVNSSPLRSELTFYAVFLIAYIVMANWPVYRLVSAAFAICALLGVLFILYALASDLNRWSQDGTGADRWWISPTILFFVALAGLFAWANNNPYKLRFPEMAAYDPDLRVTGIRGLDPLCRIVLRWLGADPAANKRVLLREVVKEQYFSGTVPQPLPDGGARLIEDITALEAWKKQVATNDGPRPRVAVVVVSGGAMRSAYWSATVLERIEEIIPEFSHHVRVIAGASGGMLGTACYVKELRSRLTEPERRKQCAFPRCVPHDNIGTVARFIALREVWRALLPFRWQIDRGVVLEDDWKLGLAVQDLYELEQQGKIPSLILSPMIVDDGRRLLISNLDLWAICKAKGGMLTESDAGLGKHDYSLSALELFRLFPLATGFQLATAVRMNASFPYVSPAVNLPSDPPRRVVDAGYYDNYGVQVASAWIRKNLNWLIANTSGVVLVQIRDAVSQKARLEVADPPTGLLATLGRGFQFFSSPLDGAKQARYTVSAFTNDQEVQSLSDLFTERFLRDRLQVAADTASTAQREEARSFFTTTVFENSAVITYGAQSSGLLAWRRPDGEPFQH